MIADKKSLPFVTWTTTELKDPSTGVVHLVEQIDTSAFDAALLAYLADRALHRFTVGEPAPWPVDERLRPIADAIERGEQFALTHADQFFHDWDAAKAMDAAEKLPAPIAADVVQTDPPSLWSRIVGAFNVLTGKVTLP